MAEYITWLCKTKYMSVTFSTREYTIIFFLSRLKTLRLTSKQRLYSQRNLQFSNLGPINQNLMVNSTSQNPMIIMKGAMEAMVHLQSTYNLDTSEMARGIIKSNNKKFDIGHVSMQAR